jgi:cathepsin B
MNVYSGFKEYEGGIYTKESGEKKLGGHAVKAIGWGIDEDAAEDATDAEKYYWICANSWGPRYGEEGYFRIRFNQDIAYKAGAVTPTVENRVELPVA